MTALSQDAPWETRSRRPSFRRYLVAALLAGGVLLLVVLASWRYRRHNFKRFEVVREGVLYRSGQLSEHGFRQAVEGRGIRTVISLRRESAQLSASLFFDPFGPSGEDEADFVTQRLGARPLHWPLGSEVYYPWLPPKLFDELFRVVDDPENRPVLVHCVGGKHRTGVFVALFRLEYDRWEIEPVLRELRSSGFEHPPRILDHNLRTYVPRPRPNEAQWNELSAAFRGVVAESSLADYQALVGDLRICRRHPAIESAVSDYLVSGRAFGLCLARRLIERTGDPLVPRAMQCAADCLRQRPADPRDWTASASLIADFGTRQQKEGLLEALSQGTRQPSPSDQYEAIVRGVTDRYRPHRVALLRPLLGDQRTRQIPHSEKYRYCDTAVAYFTSVLNVDFMNDQHGSKRDQWDRGSVEAEKWCQQNWASFWASGAGGLQAQARSSGEGGG